MSNYRILNPALTPPQIVFESNDEQATFRDYAARHDAHNQGLIVTKSEDGGMSWSGVEVRPPGVALPLSAQAAAASAPSTASLAAPAIMPSVGSVTAGQAASALGTPPISVETAAGLARGPHSPLGAAGEIDRSGVGVTRAPVPSSSPFTPALSGHSPGEVESGTPVATEPHADRSSTKHRR